MTTPLTAKSIYKKNQKKRIAKILDALPEHLELPLFSKWATDNRYYPPGISVYPGKHDPETAPHMNEILDRLHPDDPATHITVMKSVQATFTTMMESAIGASIKYKLWSMLYLTADQSLAKIRSSANIDPMIDNSNLTQYIKPISGRMRRKTGDNALYKEFSGGIKLIINSYNSIGALKSNTSGFIMCDEWSEAPPEIKGQGDIQGIIEGRTMGLRHFKILFGGTPTTMETCRTYKSFMEGDQRYYFVPCPHCGELQVLELKGNKNDWGLTFTTERDKQTDQRILLPETVRYICKHCKKEFTETKKQWMLLNGVWKPTAVPVDRNHTSYHISGLMSPEMFLSWERICQQFINTDFGSDILKFKDFTINYMGIPWASVKRQVPWKDFRDRADNYILGEVPAGEVVQGSGAYEGPLILTAGIDVQGDRLELHVVGFGRGMEKWSVDYKIFYGDPGIVNDPSWIALDEWVYSHTYTICGSEHYISMAAIDAGYDPRENKRHKDFGGKSHIVYDFVSIRTDRFIAIMGTSTEKTLGILKEARVGEQSALTKRYNVAVSLVKEILMENMELVGGPRSIHFPKYQMIDGIKAEIPDEHFKQFLSERYQEIKPKVFGWKKIYKRNEVWDTFIYAIAAAEYQNLSTWSPQRWGDYYYDVLQG